MLPFFFTRILRAHLPASEHEHESVQNVQFASGCDRNRAWEAETRRHAGSGYDIVSLRRSYRDSKSPGSQKLFFFTLIFFLFFVSEYPFWVNIDVSVFFSFLDLLICV